MSESQLNSRRHFFKLAVGFSGMALLAPKMVLGEEKRAKKPAAGAKPGAAGAATGDLALPFVEPGKGMAVNLNYVAKASDVKDEKIKVSRQDVPFAKQSCANVKCMLYTSVGKKDGVEAGKCTLFAGQLVKGTAWCSSWTKDPKA